MTPSHWGSRFGIWPSWNECARLIGFISPECSAFLKKLSRSASYARRIRLRMTLGRADCNILSKLMGRSEDTNSDQLEVQKKSTHKTRQLIDKDQDQLEQVM
jgi:hypothetical protein